jgi:hypothetical protein
MQVGGTEYNQEAARAVRVISVVVAPVLAMYSILIMVGTVPSTHYINPLITLAISLLWVATSIYYYYRPVTKPSDQGLRIAMIHVFALAMFVFVTGFAQPFAPLYVLLFLATNLYFGHRGLFISVAALVFAVIVDIVMRYESNPQIIASKICVFSIF